MVPTPPVHGQVLPISSVPASTSSFLSAGARGQARGLRLAVQWGKRTILTLLRTDSSPYTSRSRIAFATAAGAVWTWSFS